MHAPVKAQLVLAVKLVRQKHQAPNDLLRFLEEFRRPVSTCVAVGIEENISSLKTLSLKAYHQLTREMPAYYRLGVMSTATGILRNHRKVKKKNLRTTVPFARRLILTTCYGFKIQNGHLRLPVKPREFVYVKLNSHTLQAPSTLRA